jgi:DNA-binding NarL/FixJ family response regulator
VGVANPRVLIVDDDPSIRRGLRSLLEDEGVSIVAEALDGVDAINAAWETMPDLVLMDLRMPVMGGIEATRQLTHALPGCQVVICTAYDDASLHQGAKEAGAFAVLVKGCPPRQVLEIVERAWAYKQELDRAAAEPAWSDPQPGWDAQPPWDNSQPPWDSHQPRWDPAQPGREGQPAGHPDPYPRDYADPYAPEWSDPRPGRSPARDY